MLLQPSWAWSPCRKPVWNVPPQEKNQKLLTVVTWDTNYREKKWLELSFKCLERQIDRDRFDFIHIEWGTAPNPEILNYDFVKVICMNLPCDWKVCPSYDTGLQWNLGAYLAQTPWITYFHNDIIHPKQLIDIEEEIKEYPNCCYFEGYEINACGLDANKVEHGKELSSLLEELGDDYVYLPQTYKGKFLSSQRTNCLLLTINKEILIEEINGWYWNDFWRIEVWVGPDHDHIRNRMQRTNRARVGLETLRVFGIPHDTFRDDTQYKIDAIPVKLQGGAKYWSDFVNDWLPQHPYSVLRG